MTATQQSIVPIDDLDPGKAPVTDPHNDYKVTAPPPCEGCGGPAHGPINELIACLTRHMRTARAEAPHGPLASCKGCGGAHRSIDQVNACLEDKLAEARFRIQNHVGVSVEDFKQNQESSRLFEKTRGKLKRGGGQ